MTDANPRIRHLDTDITTPANTFDTELTYYADGTRVKSVAGRDTDRYGTTIGMTVDAIPYQFQAVRWDDGQTENYAPQALRRACPDDGVCHHACAAAECFRVRACGPLSNVFPGDRWPDHVLAAHGVIRGRVIPMAGVAYFAPVGTELGSDGPWTPLGAAKIEPANVSFQGQYRPCPECHHPSINVINGRVQAPCGGVTLEWDEDRTTKYITPHGEGCPAATRPNHPEGKWITVPAESITTASVTFNGVEFGGQVEQ